ncbi:MAG: hypothetical protein CSA36_02845 [Draconibacterium sp.]|nr:MAG: hypothetical protein CSA36_02845 [Draconibacterium sp.]
MKHAILLLTVLTVFQISVFAKDDDKSETRKLDGFNSVSVAAGIDLYLQMGDNYEINVVADDDIIDYIVTEVKGKKLDIYMKKRGFGNRDRFRGSRKVYITLPELRRLQASSGSDVYSENTLEAETLELKGSSSSDMSLVVACKNLSIEGSSSSDIKIIGVAKNCKIEASSACDIKARDLECEICRIDASSASDVVVTVIKELYAQASSASDIIVYGDPQIKEIKESSAGSIRQR